MSLHLVFQPSPNDIKSSKITFEITANSTNGETSSSKLDNIANVNLPVFVSSVVDIKGYVPTRESSYILCQLVLYKWKI